MMKDYPDEVPGDICDMFEDLALEVAGRGFKRYSADSILHRLRWHFHIEKGDRGFKCNNNWTAPLARWFLERHPEHKHLFELRGRAVGREGIAA